MFNYFVYKDSSYSETAYQSQVTACDQAKLVSAINCCHVSVVDMNTGEVIQIYYSGLVVKD